MTPAARERAAVRNGGPPTRAVMPARSAAGRPASPRAPTLRPALWGLGATFLALAGVEVALVWDSPAGPRWVLLLFPAAGLLYAAAALLAWWRRPASAMGAVLYLAALLWLAAGLVNTEQPALIAVGFVLAAAPIAAVLHLLLAFPSGRLGSTAARAIVAAGYAVTIVLQAPRYLFVDFPPPYDVLAIDARPRLVDVAEVVQNSIGALVIALAAVVLAGRLRRADARQRRTLWPLYAYGIAAILFIPVSANLLVHWPGLTPIQLAVWQVAVLSVAPVAFTAAALRGGFARAGGIEELGARLAAGEDARRELREGLVDAVGDPSLELVLWMPERGGFVDEAGAATPSPAERRGRGVVEVALDGRRVGAIVYDSGLVPDPAPVAAAGRVLAIALERERLDAELGASREALRDSRARIVVAGDRERRRVERNLHDGAQQRLTGLALILRLAAGRADGDPELRALLDEAGQELADALAELRELGRGLHPAILSDVGLSGALESLAERSAVPVRLEACPDGRLPEEVEVAAYYVVSEALANAAKHSGASRVTVAVARGDGRLRVRVDDDGRGGAAATPGSGLEGLRDRVEAVGGRLSLASPPGGGTVLEARLPCG